MCQILLKLFYYYCFSEMRFVSCGLFCFLFGSIRTFHEFFCKCVYDSAIHSIELFIFALRSQCKIRHMVCRCDSWRFKMLIQRLWASESVGVFKFSVQTACVDEILFCVLRNLTDDECAFSVPGGIRNVHFISLPHLMYHCNHHIFELKEMFKQTNRVKKQNEIELTHWAKQWEFDAEKWATSWKCLHWK